jgi:predicted O-methyltransferase YrrM
MEVMMARNDHYITHFEKQRAEIKRLWNIGVKTAEFLSFLVKIKRPRNILEIGTSNGYSAYWLALAAQEFDGSVHSIECDRNRYELAVKNLAGLRNIFLHFGTAEEIISTFKQGFDFIFLDANKEQYALYLKLLTPLLRDSSLIVADNTQSHEQSVQKYLDIVRNRPEFISINIPLESGLEVSIYSPDQKKYPGGQEIL